jgi:hypothetical protein
MLLTISKKIKLMGALLATVIITNCGGPSIDTIKEPVLGTEKHRLSGYGFTNREKSVNAGFVVSCNPTSKNNTILNGSIYLGSISNVYSFDDKIKLFLEINGVRHLLNITNRSQDTSEVEKKQFFKALRTYVTVKSLSFEVDARLLKNITTTANLKIILAREVSATTTELVDILTLHPDEFDSKHYKTIEDFTQKCNLTGKIRKYYVEKF